MGPIPGLIFAFLLLLSSPARSAVDSGLCFDFGKAGLKPLRPAPQSWPPEGKEQSDASWRAPEGGTGEGKDSIAWGMVSGVVAKPLAQVLRAFEDPMTTRDPKHTRVEVEVLAQPRAWLHQKISVHLKPVFFLTLDWTEEWLFLAQNPGLAGTEAAETATKVLIAYQKTGGTSHIRKFCGSVLIEKLGPELTGVSLVEEILAPRRKPEDVKQGLLGTLRTLRR